MNGLSQYFIALALFFSFQARAEILEETLVYLGAEKVSAGKLKNQPKNQMQNLREFEKSKRWGECSKIAKTQFATSGDLKPWVLIVWLRCSRQVFEEKKTAEDLKSALATFDKNLTLFISGPWKTSLWKEFVAGKLSLIENLDRSQSEPIWKEIDSLANYNDRLDADAKSRMYYVIADLAHRKHNLKQAQYFLLLSLAERENKPAREKLSSIELALNESSAKKETRTNGNGNGSSEPLPEGEKRFDERMSSAIKTSDWISFLEDAVNYLNHYPNGRRAKQVTEKIFEIFSTIQDVNANGQDKDRRQALKERALGILEKADPGRLLEWARWAHRRNDFTTTLHWSEKVLKEYKNSPQSAVLYYYAGRAAQVLGNYAKARKYLEAYVEFNSGGEDFNEALFRLALVNIRESQWASAVANLERLLVQKSIDRYELSSRYWLVRSLQALGNERATKEADEIIKKYPFSYYGIRLAAEKNNGEFVWPADLKYPQELKAPLFLTSAQKKILSRIDQLANAGWYLEAIQEISEFPATFEAKTKILLARRWAKSMAFPAVIKLVNDSTELDPSLRAMDLVAVGLPTVFSEAIENEAKVYSLSPILVRSLIRQESAFGIRATSTSNALGLMQLIPPTAQEVADSLKLAKVQIPEDVYDPEINIRMGTYYIAKMIRHFGGSVPLGLAAYNAGPSKMQIFIQGRPELFAPEKKFSSQPIDELWFDELPWAETSFYVKAILRNSVLYRSLDQGRMSLVGLLWKDLSPAVD